MHAKGKEGSITTYSWDDSVTTRAYPTMKCGVVRTSRLGIAQEPAARVEVTLVDQREARSRGDACQQADDRALHGYAACSGRPDPTDTSRRGANWVIRFGCRSKLGSTHRSWRDVHMGRFAAFENKLPSCAGCDGIQGVSPSLPFSSHVRGPRAGTPSDPQLQSYHHRDGHAVRPAHVHLPIWRSCVADAVTDCPAVQRPLQPKQGQCRDVLRESTVTQCGPQRRH